MVGNHHVSEKQDVDLSVTGDKITAMAQSQGRIIHKELNATNAIDSITLC